VCVALNLTRFSHSLAPLQPFTGLPPVFAELTIIAARPAWPWQSEMIAVLLHKPNVWHELHGWSPKYFTDELKRDIPRATQSPSQN
jgi:predicted TIM-barrel fold metal-dependent hydrolase